MPLDLRQSFEYYARMGATFHYALLGGAINSRDRVDLTLDPDPLGLVPPETPRPARNFIFLGIEADGDEFNPNPQFDYARKLGSRVATGANVKSREPILRMRLILNAYEDAMRLLRPAGQHNGDEYWWGTGDSVQEVGLLRVLTSDSEFEKRRLVARCEVFFRGFFEEAAERSGGVAQHESRDVTFRPLRRFKAGSRSCFVSPPRDICHGWWIRTDTLDSVSPHFGIPNALPAFMVPPATHSWGPSNLIGF